MATTTALDGRVAIQRIQSESDSSPSTADASPVDSPRQSPSSTSLSSISSVDNAYGKLIDTYGNEFEVPDFTIKDIRDAIPKHCFERSAMTGLMYIARDIALLATTFVVAYNLIPQIPSPAARFVLWAIYGFVQGLFGTGLWVIAHECGHGAFSASSRINNTVGWVLHSALLVPFFSWQMSHSKHHKATGHMERDMVFLPRTREEHASKIGKMVHELGELAEETPAYTLMILIGQQLVGWPQYLWTNVTGHNFHERQREGRGKGKSNGLGGGVNHFDPRSPLFDNAHARLVLMSDLGLVIAFSILFLLARRFGLGNMLVWYGVPYLWVNHWLGKLSIASFSFPDAC
jgi:omega-6 fatty acid desaturase / acyl-lipid omega-6 desaturase (Delta-12 desaturase)